MLTQALMALSSLAAPGDCRPINTTVTIRAGRTQTFVDIRTENTVQNFSGFSKTDFPCKINHFLYIPQMSQWAIPFYKHTPPIEEG